MFPPEVIDHVLSFLQWDHATLKVCAGAHPSLSKLVERHLYRHLTVQNYGRSHSGTYYHADLLKSIIENPNIANHVRSLRIYVVFYDDHQALESILPMLTQLQLILMSSDTGSNWVNLRESFRTAFTNCLQLPTLTHVGLSHIDRFPLSALDRSSSLKSLSLWGNSFHLPPSSPLVYPQSHFLDLYCHSSSSMEIITWVESRRLPVRFLKLSGDLDQSSRLWGVCANTLTTLIVNVPLNDTPLPIPLSLSCLLHLARLTVQASISFYSGIKSCLPTIMHVLNTLPLPINLVHLIIEIEISISYHLNPISDMDWSPLISFPYFDVISRIELRVRARKSVTYLPSVELLKTLKEDPQLMQLEMHPSFLINAVEEPVGNSWFDFDSD